MNMLFVNSVKGLKKKKVQILSIIALVMLSTCIFTTINSSLDRIEDNYYNYLNDNKVEHFAFGLELDYSTDYTVAEILKLEEGIFSNIDEDMQSLLDFYKMCLMDSTICENSEIYSTIESLFDYYNAYDEKIREKVDLIVDDYNINYEYQETKTITVDKFVYTFKEYDRDSNINIALLIDGNMPTEDNEITLLPAFMEENNLSIGDTYTINSNEYIIVGTASTPEYIFPLLSISTPMYQSNYHTIVFTNNNIYNSINGMIEGTYVGRFNDYVMDGNLDIERISTLFEEQGLKFNMFSGLRLMRINQLSIEIQTNRIFSEYFMYLLLGIAAVITIIITKKRIENEKKQIGILKAMGYNNLSITTSYLLYPILGGIIGGLLGYLLGLALNPFMSNLYLSTYIVPLATLEIDLSYLLYTLVLPTITLTVICFVIILYMLRHKALYLLKEGSDLKTNFLTKFISKISKNAKFKTKFRMSLASRSISKLVLIMVISFATGLLITLNLIGMNLFSSMIDKSFDGLNFDYWVQYKQDLTLEEYDDETYTLMKDFEILSITNSNGDIKEILKDDYVLSLTGIDKTATNVEIYNQSGDNVIDKIGDFNIIINKNTSDIMNIEISDVLEISYYDKVLTYTVIEINESFMGSYAYVDRLELGTNLDLGDVYNAKYTSLEQYNNLDLLEEEEINNISSLFSLVDLQDNMASMMETSSGVIYVIITFSGLMAFIIISVIANIVIEENKKNISVMKVLGYDNKTISSIVLNIYTPFIIISYLISIPIMINILKFVVSLLTDSMDYSLPIEISIPKAALGLAVLLIGYYISIFITKKNLNKIPLSESLKRE